MRPVPRGRFNSHGTAVPSRAGFLLIAEELIELLGQIPPAPLQRRQPPSRVLEVLARDQPRRLQRLLLHLVDGLLRLLQSAARPGDGLPPPLALEELAHRL